MTGPDGPHPDVIEITRHASHLKAYFERQWPECPPARRKYVAERSHNGNHAVQLPFALRLITTDVQKAVRHGDVMEARLCVVRARLIMWCNTWDPWSDLFPEGMKPSYN